MALVNYFPALVQPYHPPLDLPILVILSFIWAEGLKLFFKTRDQIFISFESIEPLSYTKYHLTKFNSLKHLDLIESEDLTYHFKPKLDLKLY